MAKKIMETVETTNLYEAAYCLEKGAKLGGQKPQKHGNKITVMLVGDNIKDTILDFYNGGQVDAESFSEQHKKLKRYVMPN